MEVLRVAVNIHEVIMHHHQGEMLLPVDLLHLLTKRDALLAIQLVWELVPGKF